MLKIPLNESWELRAERISTFTDEYRRVADKENGWYSCSIPCDVHVPLIENEILKEVTVAGNCFEAEWIEDRSWWFRKRFSFDKGSVGTGPVELVLESLDCYGNIFLNGHHLGHHKSTFYPFKTDILKYIKEENELLIRLTTGAEMYSNYDVSDHGRTVFTAKDGLDNLRGDKRRIMLRKPQYVFGWDWSPRVVTCAIAGNAYINIFKDYCIRDVHAVTECIEDNKARLKITVESQNFAIYSTTDVDVQICVEKDGNPVKEFHKDFLMRSGINYFVANITIENPDIWWPNGMGNQPLYDVYVKIKDNRDSVEEKRIRIGVRTVNLDTELSEKGTRRFVFIINGVPVFAKGANWIPADCLYARVSDSKYEALIQNAKEANFNMLRIWGGGIYEKDIFYEKCNENGILVWHDLMFSCATYPDKEKWFLDLVKEEIDYQTKRLRNQCCIVLWCGNNENHQGFHEWWKEETKPSYPGGALIYNEIAPAIIYNNCPDIPYWNSSPYGGITPNSYEAGDRHHWQECTMNEDINKRVAPEEYDKIAGGFISEYGYIGPCAKSTIEKYHGNNKVDLAGDIWKLHTNTFEKDTVIYGIKTHYGPADNLTLDDYLLYAGLCQGLMLGYSLEAIRFNQDCHGSLFWMYNDCWAETGWTIIDYYLKRKPSYYFVKRALSPLRIILRQESDLINVTCANDTGKAEELDLEYGYISFDGEYKKTYTRKIILKPYRRESVFSFEKGDFDDSLGLYYVRELNGKTGHAILRCRVFKDLILPYAASISYDFHENGNDLVITLQSDVYIHGVHFGLDDYIMLSDEYFDLLPCEKREITIYDVKGKLKQTQIIPRGVMRL